MYPSNCYFGTWHNNIMSVYVFTNLLVIITTCSAVLGTLTTDQANMHSSKLRCAERAYCSKKVHALELF